MSLERHYTVQNIAALWRVSPKLVRGVFRDRPDVLKLGLQRTPGARPRILLRIPASTLARVEQERSRGWPDVLKRSEGETRR